MENSWNSKINVFLTKVIVFFLYLFALGLFTSRKLTSNCIEFICLLGLIQMVIIGENPFKKIKEKNLFLPIILFTFALFASMVGNHYAEVFPKVKEHLLIFLFFYFAVINLHNLKQLKILIAIASISMLIATIYGTYQYYVLKMSRPEGFLFQLTFGCFLAIFMIFMIIYGLWGKTKIAYRLTTIPITLFFGANLLFTKARGAWLGFLGGLLTLTWLKNKKLLAPLLIIILILYLFLPQVYIERFRSSFDTKTDASNLTRIALWKGALLMYRDHLINGVGLGRFGEEYHTNYKQSYPVAEKHRHPHNNILHYMAETGTIGLIAFIWLMFAIIIWLYKSHLQITNPNWRLFTLASLCGVIIYNIQGLTDLNYGGNKHGDAMRFFWFLIALNMVVVKLCKEDSQQI